MRKIKKVLAVVVNAIMLGSVIPGALVYANEEKQVTETNQETINEENNTTVGASNSVADNLSALTSYISTNGTSVGSGGKKIETSRSNMLYWIIYYASDNKIEFDFMIQKSSVREITMLTINASTGEVIDDVMCGIYNTKTDKTEYYSTNFPISTYTGKETFSYRYGDSVSTKSYMTNNSEIDSLLALSCSTWETLLLETAKLNLANIGFKSYGVGAGSAAPQPSGRVAQYYNLKTNGGEWKSERYYLNGEMKKDCFFCDGTYTYYLESNGAPMKDRLTYHPDGVHVIYFDENGHEVFSNFAHVKKAIAGNAVDDYCFFDVYGYMYVDVMTYDVTGKKLYYINPYGQIERKGWFKFSNTAVWAGTTKKVGTGWGYGQADGSLMINKWTTNKLGKRVYMQGDGHMK